MHLARTCPADTKTNCPGSVPYRVVRMQAFAAEQNEGVVSQFANQSSPDKSEPHFTFSHLSLALKPHKFSRDHPPQGVEPRGAQATFAPWLEVTELPLGTIWRYRKNASLMS